MLRRWKPSPAILITLLGLSLTFVLVRASWRDTLREHEKVFTLQSEAVHEQLVEHIKATDEMAASLATFINSAAHIDADQFRLFADEMLRRHSYLLSASYLPHVAADERLDFERRRHEAGFPRFSISDRLGDEYQASSPRLQYFPLLFIEPFEPTSVVMIGFDVLSDPLLAPTVQAAIDTALPTATPPRRIDGRAWGYWLFATIYAGKSAPTAAERGRAVNGLVALRINAERLLAQSVGARPVTARLRMIPSGSEPLDLAQSAPGDDRAGQLAIKIFRRATDIRSGGQHFRLDMHYAVSWHEVNYLPVAAVLLTCLLATTILTLAARRAALKTRLLEQKNIEVERLVAEKTAELALEKERALVTLASIGDGVITTDAAGRVEYLNAVAEVLTGWTAAEARGLHLAEVFRVRPADDSSGALPDGPTRDCLLVNRQQEEIGIDQSVAPICGRDGEVLGSVVVFHDVSLQQQLAREISYQATHDTLTALHNRRAFEDRLNHLLETARSDGVQHTLLYFDLDQFKIVNDACGHSAGDQLLRQLSALLQEELRQSDVLARLGGDEFGVLLQNCPGNEGEKVARNMLYRINDFRFVWKERVFTVGASIGLVSFDGESENAAAILSAADAACYAAKDKGRNRVLVYQSDDIELNHRRSQMQWVTRLRHALEENRFLLYCQPIMPLAVGITAPVHQEVLLRLREDDGAIVLPDSFLPAAERYGLMPEIDRWVVRSTLQWLTAHADDPNLAAAYSINLSGHSLSDAQFLRFVLDELERTGVPPERVRFEITETAAVTVGRGALGMMQTLRNKGCQFVLDDFGSGWSTFAYLKNLPVDFLKIDGSLVRDIDHDVLDEAMVRAISEIGRVLGIATIAEFVEDEVVLERVRALGIEFGQGYALGGPVPIDAHLLGSVRQRQTDSCLRGNDNLGAGFRED